MSYIPLVDLKAQYKNLEPEISRAINRCLASSDFILGQDLAHFETEFAQFIGVNYAIGVASGTDALTLALLACGVRAGDEVVVPANTFIATAFAVSHVGAKPVFVDVSENDFNIDTSKLPLLITKKTKAIIPVHLYGRMVEMNAIEDLARNYDIAIIEDACQAHGAQCKDKKAGSIGHAGAFSFYPGKNLGAYGDGGIVVTNNKNIAESIQMLRNYGQKVKYKHELFGYNSRLDNLQAAILRVKLRRLDDWNERRQEIARLYNELLAETPLVLPNICSDLSHVYHLYVIRAKERDKLLKHLNDQGIGASIHYPVPVHLQKPYRDLGYREGLCPVSERLCSEVISLPIYPEMTDTQVRRIADAVCSFYAS